MNRKAQHTAWYSKLTVPQCDRCAEILRQDGLAAGAKKLAVEMSLGKAPSITAAHEFLSRWPMRRACLTAGNTADLVRELLSLYPELAQHPEKIEAVAQSVFTAVAVQQQDPKEYARMKMLAQRDQEIALAKASAQTKARQKDEQIDIARRHQEMLEKKAAQADAAKAITTNRKLSQEERAAKMRELFGVT